MSTDKPFFIMENQKEVWKDVKGYEGYYQVSNLGRVKSVDRIIYKNNGVTQKTNGGILSPGNDGRGYYHVGLCKNGKRKDFKVHKLVAMAFLNHTPCGYKKVVNHIDNNPTNNRSSNLEIVTQRENVCTHYIGTSKYKGVYYSKNRKKWRASIYYNGKANHLGMFENELDASNAYQNALNNIINN